MMYYIKKRLEISASHSLDLEYESPCRNLHGHNWIITVYCKSETLDANGMIVDFAHVSSNVKDLLDHKNLNDVFSFNPTAENIACYLTTIIKNCYRVDVQETENSFASYEVDGQ